MTTRISTERLPQISDEFNIQYVRSNVGVYLAKNYNEVYLVTCDTDGYGLVTYYIPSSVNKMMPLDKCGDWTNGVKFTKSSNKLTIEFSN